MAILQSRPPTSTPQQSARGRGQSATGVHSFRIPPHRSSAGPPPRRSTSSWPPHSSANFSSSTTPDRGYPYVAPASFPPPLSGYSMQRSSNFPFPPAVRWQLDGGGCGLRKERDGLLRGGWLGERTRGPFYHCLQWFLLLLFSAHATARRARGESEAFPISAAQSPPTVLPLEQHFVALPDSLSFSCSIRKAFFFPHRRPLFRHRLLSLLSP